MATPWTLTMDCQEPALLARFWAVALGYVDKPPPTGWASWEDWLRHFEVPEDEWDDGASLCDPEGVLPSLSLLRVPEQKVAKNRLHIDLQVAGGRHVDQAVREQRIEETVARLEDAGGTVLRRDQGPHGLDHVVMADPEGNELCVV